MGIAKSWKGLLAVALLIALPASAQQSSGRAAPDKHILDLGAYFLQFPLAKADAAYADIDGRRMKQWIDQQVVFSRQSRDAGNLVWGRIAGEEHDAKTHGWAADLFKKFGLSNVHMQEIDLPPQWRATSWDVTATAGGKTFQPQSVFPAPSSPGTKAGGLDLEAVWVGLGTDADFAGRDVKGKLVVIYSWPNSAPHGASAWWMGAVDRAAKAGAAAMLINRAVPGNIKVIYRSGSIPTMFIGTDDTNILRTMIAQGPVKMHFELGVKSVPGLKDANVWGTLPGTTDEAIYIKAHHDGYFDGALDNASGVATLMALAEHFAKVPRAKRRYTLHFISVAGHHGMADDLWLNDKAASGKDPILVINLEHTALISFRSFGDSLRQTNSMDALRWTANGSAALAKLVFDSFSSFGVPLYADMEGVSAAPRPGQQFGWYERPMRIAPSVDLINSPQWVYHGDNDVADNIPPAALTAAARGFAKLIDGVNKLRREQIRWEGAADSGVRK